MTIFTFARRTHLFEHITDEALRTLIQKIEDAKRGIWRTIVVAIDWKRKMSSVTKDYQVLRVVYLVLVVAIDP